MKYHWLDKMDGLIIEGDIITSLAQLEDESVEAIVTDPPYELNFMGKGWDNAGVSFRAATWKACLRVLKPGGHLVVFGGTRTHHRMWVAIEDAGFEVRDMLLWMYGQGFPKSHNVSAAIDRKLLGKGPRGHAIATAGTTQVSTGKPLPPGDNLPPYQAESEAAQKFGGWGTALKPACEPILLARKPLSEKTVAANVLKHGTGALNIDATRISTEGEIIHTPKSDPAKREGVVGSDLGFSKGSKEKMAAAQQASIARTNELGRWPANVMLQCTCDDPQPVPEKVHKRHGEPSQERRYDKEGATNFAAEPGIRREGGGFVHEPECPAGMLDAQTGNRPGCTSPSAARPESKFRPNQGSYMPQGPIYGDKGGASRFFYCPKATKKEREQGLDDLEIVLLEWESWEGEAHEAKLLVDMAPSHPKVIGVFGSGDASEWSMMLFGNSTTAPSLQNAASIIETKTNSTIESKTLSWLTHLLTNDYTADANSEKASGGNHVESVDDSNPKLSIIVGKTVSLPGVGRVRSGTRLRLNGNAGSPATHPTVKPIALMRYLVRLVTPPDGIVLDPFCGSGSTLIAATEEGFGFIGVDVSPEYCELAQQRLRGRNA